MYSKIPRSVMQLVKRRPAIRRASADLLYSRTVITFPRRFSHYDEAAAETPLAKENGVPQHIREKLKKVKRVPKKNYMDTFASVAGWGVVAVGLGISFLASRAMIERDREMRLVMSQNPLEMSLPEVIINPDGSLETKPVK